MQQSGDLPHPQGLYDPQHEKDSCGVGFVVHLKGKRSHAIVEKGLELLVNLEHRGACGCEANTGDGAGLLIQMPDVFFRSQALGFELPPVGDYGAGLIFLPNDPAERELVKALFGRIVAEEGQRLLGWRHVPTDDRALGERARAAEPVFEQVFIGRGNAPAPSSRDPLSFERKLYVVRKRIECEADALPRFVERFAATGLELLVVDDASPDATGELADALAAERPWMHVLHRAGKDGLGMAYRAGFAWCLDRGYRVIGQMDSDLSHPPEKLAEMLSVLDARQADLVLGNRYMPGGGTAGWSKARRVLSRLGCTGSKLVLGLPFDDLSGGFKLWRASTLAELDFDSMLSTGYAFQVETTQLAYLMGKRIEEVPFVFSERIAGESKMTLGVSLEGIRVTFALRRRARGRRAGLLVT